MADVVYHGLRQIWLEKLRASERGSLVHWVYWLLLHLEATVFVTDDNFEKEASIVRVEVNGFRYAGGDAASVCRFRLTILPVPARRSTTRFVRISPWRSSRTAQNYGLM